MGAPNCFDPRRPKLSPVTTCNWLREQWFGVRGRPRVTTNGPILIRSKLKSAMLRRTSDDDLAAMAQRRVEDVARVQRILSHAIQVFAARGEPDRVNAEHQALARPWLGPAGCDGGQPVLRGFAG